MLFRSRIPRGEVVFVGFEHIRVPLAPRLDRILFLLRLGRKALGRHLSIQRVHLLHQVPEPLLVELLLRGSPAAGRRPFAAHRGGSPRLHLAGVQPEFPHGVLVGNAVGYLVGQVLLHERLPSLHAGGLPHQRGLLLPAQCQHDAALPVARLAVDAKVAPAVGVAADALHRAVAELLVHHAEHGRVHEPAVLLRALDHPAQRDVLEVFALLLRGARLHALHAVALHQLPVAVGERVHLRGDERAVLYVSRAAVARGEERGAAFARHPPRLVKRLRVRVLHLLAAHLLLLVRRPLPLLALARKLHDLRRKRGVVAVRVAPEVPSVCHGAPPLSRTCSSRMYRGTPNPSSAARRRRTRS